MKKLSNIEAELKLEKKSVAYKKACSWSWKEGEPPLAHPYGSNPDQAYSEPSETYKMKLFAKIVNSSILGTWLGSEYVSDDDNSQSLKYCSFKTSKPPWKM